ncbi:D-lactaldehyde dehydrogenase [Pisolithus sp. B1]|nr:D-lactaldehyde dehydrogenase [Pisolithus sp. B1]
MPVIQPRNKVLVTGANGFLAAWVVRDLLEHGYSVRGAVRSVEKGEHLQSYFADYSSKLEIIVGGAFDEAVKGIDAVAHVASPLTVGWMRAEDLMNPAIKGTVGLLQSALKYGQSIKRIVYTSTAGTVSRETHEITVPTVFTEKDWNTRALEIFKEQGDKTPVLTTYRASKVLAEQDPWGKVTIFHRGTLCLTVWDMLWIRQPVIHDVTDPSSLKTSMRWFYDYVVDPVKSADAGNDFLAKTGLPWVDVRDLAAAHRLAPEKQEAGSEQILISGPWAAWQAFIDVANALEPTPRLARPLPKGNPGSSHPAMRKYDATKSERILGLKYRSMVEMTRDTLSDFSARGW